MCAAIDIHNLFVTAPMVYDRHLSQLSHNRCAYLVHVTPAMEPYGV